MRWEVALTTLLLLFFCVTFAYMTESQARVARTQAGAQTATVKDAVHATSTSTATATTTVRVPIFIYHSVRPDFAGETKSQEDYSVTPQELDAQLAYIRDHGYTVISLDELEKDIKAGTTSPSVKAVVLTFDDGWQNEFDYALPILKKYNDTATFFIFTNPIGKDKRFMTWDEVKALEASGMTIGAHSLSHPYFNKLSQEEMRHEVAGSKQALEAALGHPVTHFATPFGYTSPALEAILKSVGFTTGRTTYWGAAHTQAELLHLSGYISPRDMKHFVWELEKAP